MVSDYLYNTTKNQSIRTPVLTYDHLQPLPFNQRVPGSSPGALTTKINVSSPAQEGVFAIGARSSRASTSAFGYFGAFPEREFSIWRIGARARAPAPRRQTRQMDAT
jgi:hypothetical protein